MAAAAMTIHVGIGIMMGGRGTGLGTGGGNEVGGAVVEMVLVIVLEGGCGVVVKGGEDAAVKMSTTLL